MRQRRHGADLDMAETKRGETSPGNAILVIPGCQSDRVGKMQPKNIHWFLRRRKQSAQEKINGLERTEADELKG